MLDLFLTFEWSYLHTRPLTHLYIYSTWAARWTECEKGAINETLWDCQNKKINLLHEFLRFLLWSNTWDQNTKCNIQGYTWDFLQNVKPLSAVKRSRMIKAKGFTRIWRLVICVWGGNLVKSWWSKVSESIGTRNLKSNRFQCEALHEHLDFPFGLTHHANLVRRHCNCIVVSYINTVIHFQLNHSFGDLKMFHRALNYLHSKYKWTTLFDFKNS